MPDIKRISDSKNEFAPLQLKNVQNSEDTKRGFHDLHIVGMDRDPGLSSSPEISPGPSTYGSGGRGKPDETGMRIPTPGRDPTPQSEEIQRKKKISVFLEHRLGLDQVSVS